MYGEYTPHDQGQRKVDVRILKAEGISNCKLPMTEVNGSMIRYVYKLVLALSPWINRLASETIFGIRQGSG